MYNGSIPIMRSQCKQTVVLSFKNQVLHTVAITLTTLGTHLVITFWFKLVQCLNNKHFNSSAK